MPPCAPRSHGRTGRSPGCPPASPRKPQTCSWQTGTTRSVCFCLHISNRAHTHQFVHTVPAGASSRCTHGPRSSPGRRQPTRSLQVAPGSRKKNRVKKERKKVAPRRSPPSSTCSPLRALPLGAGHPSAGLACVVRMCKHFLPPSTKLLARLDYPFQHPKYSSKA